MSLPSIAFIGAGRMASAIVEGLVTRGGIPPDGIRCLSARGDSARVLSEKFGVRAAKDLPDLLTGADLVVVAFKPQHLSQADSRLAELTAGKLVLSVLAAKTL